ncbi:MAG: hypothetical protein K6U89_18900, partial [Chloroflexi bacterium]|nr:hypothetical protein [Chloroflexota bacterium]
ECARTGLYLLYLPKGSTRRYRANPAVGTGYAPHEIVPGLIEEARDANNNVTTYLWTTFPDQIHAYIASVRDPVHRTTSYTYERSYEVCVQEGPQGQCQATRWHYRVRTVTDP